MKDKQGEEEVKESKKWKLIGHSYQIADTGDYDGHWEITDGKISILTKDDDDEETLQPIVDALNDSGKPMNLSHSEKRIIEEEINNNMENKKCTVQIFESSDYSRFNMVKGNRELDMNKLKKILADIDRGTNLLKYVPILVVEKKGKFDIVDGQHRFMVSKKIKSPIFYIIGESLSLYDIARMNSNTEKWKSKDFINCYSELGNENYKKLEAFLKSFPGLTVSHAIRMLSRGKGAEKISSIENFQMGQFVVSSEKEAFDICNAAKEFNFVCKYAPAFLVAISKIMDAGHITIGDLAGKVNAAPDQLHSHINYKKYLLNLEEIANKNKHKRVAIY
jgi:hypothetical protein